jgi:hypothetical protein
MAMTTLESEDTKSLIAGHWEAWRFVGRAPIGDNFRETISKPPQGDHEAGDMEERSVTLQQSLIAHQQAAKVADPYNRTFYSPAPLRSARLRTYQLDASLRQLLPQRVTDVTPVGNEAFRLLPGRPA